MSNPSAAFFLFLKFFKLRGNALERLISKLLRFCFSFDPGLAPSWRNRHTNHGTAPLTRRRRAAAAQEHYEWDGGEEEEPEATDDGAADWAAMEDDLEDEHGWGVDEGDDDGAEEDGGEDGGDDDE